MRAGIRHGVVEHELVELVAEVVVRGDVARAAVPAVAVGPVKQLQQRAAHQRPAASPCDSSARGSRRRCAPARRDRRSATGRGCRPRPRPPCRRRPHPRRPADDRSTACSRGRSPRAGGRTDARGHRARPAGARRARTGAAGSSSSLRPSRASSVVRVRAAAARALEQQGRLGVHVGSRVRRVFRVLSGWAWNGTRFHQQLQRLPVDERR